MKFRSERRRAYQLDKIAVGTVLYLPADADHAHARVAVSEYNRVNHLTGEYRLRTQMQPDGRLLIYVNASLPAAPIPTKEQFTAYLRVMAKGQTFAMGSEYMNRFAEFEQTCKEFSEADGCSIVAIRDDPEKLVILRQS